jgi:predicted lipoprotein with Yx(FWY)xxD motif
VLNASHLLIVLVDNVNRHQKEPTMRHPRIVIAGISLAAVAAVGGTVASAGSSSANSAPSARANTAATVRTAPATVAGATETILVNGRGLPLYIYRPDTAARSLVTGSLARLWPPLTSPAPSAAGVNGKLTVLNDANGHQVTYNGHPLYTFVGDHPDQVNGQGVQNFAVATPGIAQLGASSAPAAPAPAAPIGGGGY